ncbi:DUF7289 family protein [Natronorubrum sulfidifaciens]|uniref:Uncharacterized protein n=1 Tax=Natronorubrum sulfidifaciens JCM 14089 TaxID=1230460 RepID=L9W818_9EURY|nr:hypothetical protein [Natronorubrum sulfidifaciens]ELY44463.1 hypothetical protein C495_11189 [Natronorubrum sulfidifaciens JCM 14089]
MIDRRADSRANDRAVSEVVAFVLVFAIILGSVGILYSTGFQAMDDYQENEQLVNAERAMDALADNFNDVIRYNGVNQRYGELSLRDGAVRTSDSGTNLDILIEKGGENRSIADRDETKLSQYYTTDETLDLGEFAYTSDGDRIAYEGGGLVRGDDSEDWSLVRKQPHITCSDDREAAVISLVTISADDRSVQSSSGLGVTMSVENRSSAVYTDDVDSVSITIEDDDTAYNDAWDSTLDTDRGWTDNDNGDDLRRTCPADRVVVTIVEVDLEY